MDRSEAHRLLDATCDKLDAAAAANDPSTRLRLEDEAHTLWQRLTVGVIGAVRSRRHAAALAARNPFDLSVAAPEAVDAGQWTWTRDVLRTHDGAAAARRVLARAMLDDATLPPSLRVAGAAALFQLNLGERDTWIGRPLKIRGLPGTHARDFLRNLALLARIYYRAGYDGLKNLGDAAAIEIPQDRDGKHWTALQKARDRHRLAGLGNSMKSQGEQDKAAGKPFAPPLALD